MSRFLAVATALLCLAISCGNVRAAPAQVTAIALTRGDLPANVTILAQFTHYYPTQSISDDTVPAGFTARQLRGAGVQGMLIQQLMRAHDPNIYGYSWQYLAFSSAAAAHRIYRSWFGYFKYPFTKRNGATSLCSEGEKYTVISVQPAQAALLCRMGRVVVLGHYSDASTLAQLMRTVLGRARHAGFVRRYASL